VGAAPAKDYLSVTANLATWGVHETQLVSTALLYGGPAVQGATQTFIAQVLVPMKAAYVAKDKARTAAVAGSRTAPITTTATADQPATTPQAKADRAVWDAYNALAGAEAALHDYVASFYPTSLTQPAGGGGFWQQVGAAIGGGLQAVSSNVSAGIAAYSANVATVTNAATFDVAPDTVANATANATANGQQLAQGLQTTGIATTEVGASLTSVIYAGHQGASTIGEVIAGANTQTGINLGYDPNPNDSQTYTNVVVPGAEGVGAAVVTYAFPAFAPLLAGVKYADLISGVGVTGNGVDPGQDTNAIAQGQEGTAVGAVVGGAAKAATAAYDASTTSAVIKDSTVAVNGGVTAYKMSTAPGGTTAAGGAGAAGPGASAGVETAPPGGRVSPAAPSSSAASIALPALLLAGAKFL